MTKRRYQTKRRRVCEEIGKISDKKKTKRQEGEECGEVSDRKVNIELELELEPVILALTLLFK